MSLVICVVSRTKRSGKTALIERLLKRFTSEGFKVATVKHISGFFDTAKKDTRRHIEAGAIITVASTRNEIVTVTRTLNPPLEEALEAIYIKSELVLVEGYKKSPYPKMLCADTAKDAQAALREIANITMVSGPISSIDREKETFEAETPKPPVYDFEEVVSALKEMLADSILKDLPALDCKKCGYDSCRDLARAILDKKATIKDCEVLTTEVAILKVDGENVPLGKFPQQILRGVTLGVLETLKSVRKNPKRIEITIKTDAIRDSSQ